jgi:threonine dehydrogenase-like Zn-dependent dehydrogenase
MNTCKAAVFVGAGKPLEVREFPVPEVEPGAVLVQMQIAAVCGTDVHASHNPTSPHPVIFGHENVGVIAQKGRGVTTDALDRPLKEGDRIIFRAAPCGRCYNCSVGLSCRANPTPGFIPFTKPPYIRGGFGQYLYLDPNPWILRIPDEMSTDRALLAVIGNHTVTNGIDRIGGIGLGDTVVVQGSGPIGMGALNQSRIKGAARVIVVGAPAERLTLAREMGADETISLKEYPSPEARIERVRDLTSGHGADVVIECSGANTAVQEGLEMVRVGGKYLVVGQLTDYGPKSINPSLITRKAVLISGVLGSTFQHIIRSVEAMNSVVKHPVEKLITHRFPLEGANEAFHSHETLEAMVAVILPNG